ncbi:MAG: translation initiation factor IF-3 [Candidatus Eisenbacteria bacterium]|uniref:Translation initiation factor IF-3 n=1 Tax=Eiseniibacteriota bacterium TaxID=2212470 RepID=A0A948W685_UNCEI|nr:translation initiation factor IF-3 [Candidatus Eisenbacteria bacterium]MBU1949623.1 translation initiation factor IF-3 [Candidatus Eisenbacteria bacterium]MBU2690371.1 translation initiation factor IF-3 [Candidatus Eisenbacteria bacterium]
MIAIPARGKDTVNVNEGIRTPMVRVVSADGEQLGVMAISEALQKAREAKLDLVEVASNAVPPVCRIMDYGKFKFEKSKKERQARRKQHHSTIKEIKLRPKIEKHDYEFKMKHVRRFLENRDKVKITIRFRGREITRTESGTILLTRVKEEMDDLAVVEVGPKMEGRTMIIVLTPRVGRKPGDTASAGG